MPYNTPWSPEELAILKQHYNHMPVAELQAKFFPKRSIHAIIQIANRENISIKKMLPVWDEESIRFLKQNYETMNYADLTQALNRSKKAIDTKAQQLKLHRAGHKKPNGIISKPWQPYEEELIRNFARKDLTDREFQQKYIPYRTLRAIQTKIRNMGLSQKLPEKWTNEENDIIIKNYKTKQLPEWESLLPNRTYGAIRNQIMVLKHLGLIK